eukprot:4988455-Amphidinium_carterae.1
MNKTNKNTKKNCTGLGVRGIDPVMNRGGMLEVAKAFQVDSSAYALLAQNGSRNAAKVDHI